MHETMLELHKTYQIFRCVFFSPDAMSKERQLYQSNIWCTVRVESDLWGLEQEIFYRRFDVSTIWENQLKNPVFQPYPTHTPYICWTYST